MILNANHMLIRLGYDIALRLPFPTAVIYVLHVHPARKGDLVGSEDFRIEPELSVEEYFDGFGNHCGRVNSPAGVIRFLNHAIIRDPGTHSIPTHSCRNPAILSSEAEKALVTAAIGVARCHLKQTALDALQHD